VTKTSVVIDDKKVNPDGRTVWNDKGTEHNGINAVVTVHFNKDVTDIKGITLAHSMSE
jgi:hypothetical protein